MTPNGSKVPCSMVCKQNCPEVLLLYLEIFLLNRENLFLNTCIKYLASSNIFGAISRQYSMVCALVIKYLACSNIFAVFL